jgi:hypothetical protein
MPFDPIPDPEVQMIERTGPHANQYLVGLHLGAGKLAPLEGLGSSMVGDSVGEHGEIVAATPTLSWRSRRVAQVKRVDSG